MQKYGIQNFTSPKGNNTFPVACGSIVTVLPFDSSYVTGSAFNGAKSLLMTAGGAYIGVIENVDQATSLWIAGREQLGALVGHA